MSVIKVSPKVLARAASVDDVAELSVWKESDVLAIAESALAAVVAEASSASVCNRVIDSLRAADGSPQYTTEVQGAQVAVYVLMVSSPASPASLTAKQQAWAEAHPAADVWVLPCVVQHLKKDHARCVVDSVYVLRSRGHWSSTPENRQFMPASQRAAHFLGGAAILKEHNTVREVANGGTRIYPYIAGVASHRNLPQGHELRCSGHGEFPLMLVQTRGAQNGALRVVHAGVYSAENPVNELEIYAIGKDSIELMDSRGHVYSAACAELCMFPDCLKVGMHLRWSVNVFADSYAPSKASVPRFEGDNVHVKSLVSVVKSVKAIDYCGLSGYCLQVPVQDKQPDLLFNIYVFTPMLGGRVPKVGDAVMVSGKLQVAPDSLVETSVCWADSPETTAASHDDELDLLALQEKTALLPYGAPLAELAAAFVKAGYRMKESFLPLFRFGRPEFRLESPQGTLLFVMLDCVVNQHEDKLGYRCRFTPDKYPAHMNQTPQGDGPADICFATLHVSAVTDSEYTLAAELHGVAPELHLPELLALPAAEPLSQQDAARLFADCMATQSFESLLPSLSEAVHYCSETAGLEFFSKMDLLRHLRSCFDTWKKHNVLKDIAFNVRKLAYQGKPCFCCVASQSGEPVSVTLVSLQHNRITEIQALAPAQFPELSASA